jgi:hypothetical protein
MEAAQIIQNYQLLPHPEGGWYKETYRSTESIAADALPKRFNDSRSLSTAIYFLMEANNFSAFHRIQSDECWHFYAGGTLEIYIIDLEGKLSVIPLGNHIDKGEFFQFVVPANCWFASKPAAGVAFSFVGCTVSPGFDFNDFELADSEMLTRLYPQHHDIIKSLSRS